MNIEAPGQPARQDQIQARPVLIVMVKAPRAGFAKTRLAPVLSEEQAATLAVCFAQDTLQSATRIVRDVIVAYTPDDARAMLERILSGNLMWTKQRGDGLGERLEAAVTNAATRGFSPLVIIGTDSPTRPPSFIETALDALVNLRADLALGATDDGGFYLVGLRKPVPGLFQNIAWSTSEVYQQTVSNAARRGLRVQHLSHWYDVDTPSDLLRLRDELYTNKEAQERAPSTYQWLLAHDSSG